MNWDTKFSHMLKETECNLAKVKERMQTSQASQYNMDSSHAYKHPNGHKYLDLKKKPFISTSMTEPMKSDATFFSPYKSQATEPYLSTNEAFCNDSQIEKKLGDGMASQITTSGMMTLLHDKIDAQAKSIEMLRHSVKTIEEERDTYSRQVKELRDDIIQLNSRLNKRGLDPQTERTIDRWKQEVSLQISSVQEQIQSVNTWNEKNGNFNESQTAQLIRDVQDLRQTISTECDGLRYSIESVKNRLEKLEVDLNSTNMENRNISQRQSFMDKNMRNYIAEQKTPPPSLRRYTSDLEIVNLKSSIDTIRSRLGSMEKDLKRNSNYSSSGSKNHRNSRMKRSPGNILSPDTSDLNDSDLDLSVLDERPKHRKKSTRSSSGKKSQSRRRKNSIDELNDSNDDLDDIKTADLEDVVTANTADLHLSDDELLDDFDLENDHELSIDELN